MNWQRIITYVLIIFAFTISPLAGAQKNVGGKGQGNLIEKGQGAFTAGRDGFTSNYGMGTEGGKSFAGIRISWVKPNVTRIQIRRQGNNGAVLFNGPVSPGQFISLPTRNLTVTGWVNGGGNHYSAIKYVRCWR